MNQIPSPKSQIPNIVLIGYRGTGKTTVGRALAARLDWPFVDADEAVEALSGKSIAEIFSAGGEPAFRDLEQQIVAELSRRSEHVISLGGGAVLRNENRQAIRESGTVVWLTASAQTIHDRLRADGTTAERRPNLTQRGGLEEIQQLLAEREALYRECADMEVDTDTRSLGDVVDAIVKRLP